MTDATTRVTLGDVPLGTFRFSWAIKAGVTPETRVVNGSSARIDKIMELGPGPHTLSISTGSETVNVQGIYVLGEQPGDSPHTRAVTIADARWLWQRKLVSRSYNIRRRTGRRRSIGDRAENTVFADDVWYASWSLNGGKAWTLRDVLEDVLGEVHGKFRLPASFDRETPIQDLELNMPGHNAVHRLLQYVSGYGVYLDYDGTAVVYDEEDTSNPVEGRKVHVGTGYSAKVDKARVRPAWIDVYFVPEVEVRFDYAEDTQFTTQSRNREQPLLENVAPLAEFKLVVDGKTAAQGEWHKIGDAAVTANSSTGGLLQAFEDNNPANATARTSLGGLFAVANPLSQSVIRKYYFPGVRSILASYTQLPKGKIDKVWLARTQSILQHYRTTFRILPGFFDKCRFIKAYRAGLIDAESETGVRAPSQVWTDYTTVPSTKGLIRRETDDASKAWVVSGWSSDLTTVESAPAYVHIADQEQGIIQILPRNDPWGYSESVILGHPDKTPNMDLRDCNNAAKLDALTATWGGAGLKSGWKLSTILSVIPSGPNSLQRLYKRTVYAQEIDWVGAAEGPPMSVYIGPGIMTAMIGWTDTDSSRILELFYGDKDGNTSWDSVERLLVNGDAIHHVATAAASRVYSLYLERHEGSFRGPLDGDAVPKGNLKSVIHQVKWQGPGQTTVGTVYQLPPILEPTDLEPFLPETIRRVVLKTAQP